LRVHLEQENTQEKEKFFQERESFLDKQNATWKLAQQCVTRQYPKKDVDMAHYLQDKYPNVNTIAKDSCFHFGYMAKKGGEGYEQESYVGRHDEQDDKYITKHFDFRLDGNINGQESGKQNDFAYAYFRDELKGKVNKGEKCNPDINIEQNWGDGSGESNSSNPHWTQVDHANERELGLNGGRENQTSYSREWNNDYELDLIGREYCRDRSIGCTKEEFDTLMIWQEAKGMLITAHEKWITSILDQMKEIKLGLKGYRYLDEAIELCTELGLSVNDAEIIRTNSTGLVIYNPKNLADRIKGMKNKSISREQKIALRKAYNQQQSTQ